MERLNTKWLISNAIVMTFALLLAVCTQSIFWLPLVAFSSFNYLFYSTSIAYKTSNSRSTKSLNSYANQVTAFRFLLSAITAILVFRLSETVSFCLFGLAILLDGLDGYLARKYQQTSEIGALFDKTVDAYFVLLLSFILVTKYKIPYWFLGIGYLHYGYEILLLGLGWQDLTVPKNPIGKYIAALLSLSLLGPFILSAPVYLPVLYLAAILVSFSFSLSFFYKYKASTVKE